MAKLFEYEIALGARRVVQELAKIQPGERVAVTADTMCAPEVVEAVAGAVHAVGAKVLVLWYPTPGGVGKDADKDISYQAIGEAIGASDVWLEFGYNWILYSTAQEIALSRNPNLRHINMVGMNPEMFVRLVAKTDAELLAKFQMKVTEMTKQAKHVRITSPAGTDLEFDNDHDCPFYCELGIADKPGTAYLAGQICWFPKNETIQGVLVFDGSLNPPCGVLTSPVAMTIENGYVKKVSGGSQAKTFESWLAHFNDPLMYRMAHVCYGLHPNAILTGVCVEDERIWGSTEWGMGYLPVADAPPTGIDAASHCDGITLNSSLWLDGVQVLDKGEIVHPDLVEMAKQLRG